MLKNIPKWATVNPSTMSSNNMGLLSNLINGEWHTSYNFNQVIDPLNGEKIINYPVIDDINLYKKSMQKCNINKSRFI